MGLFSKFLTNKHQSVYTLPIDSYMNDKTYLLKQKKYYAEMEKVENQWSVLYNLKNFNNELALKYIHLCETNIAQFQDMDLHGKEYSDYTPPIVVPAYKRLAMIYEKQGKFAESAQVCFDAIAHGIVQDGTKAGLKGRAARMLKKAGIEPTEEQLDILME